MATRMRAKMRISNVSTRRSEEGAITSEVLVFDAVAKSSAYPADGSDEDNTFAKFSPQGRLELTIANPALFGKIAQGERFYLDFSPAE